MKLLFLLGSLEPGRDGVGDYTRKLGGELVRLGHEVHLIATHDKQVESVTEENQQDEEVLLASTRIPQVVKATSRLTVIQKALATIKPDWVSLQYVPYSFHTKGLPFRFISLLQRVIREEKVHIMFHECWVGISRIEPLKHHLIGALQSWLATRLVDKLNPAVISTSNALYQNVLKSKDIDARILGLFSNIGFYNLAEQKLRTSSPLQDLIQLNLSNQASIIGIFGNISPNIDLILEVDKLKERADVQGKSTTLVSLGRSGPDGKQQLNELAIYFGDNVKQIRLGELPENEVSIALQQLDYAIPGTPPLFLGKSGVYAAMRLHKVEVAIPATKHLPEYEWLASSILERLQSKSTEAWTTKSVTKEFVKLLS